MVIHVLKWVIVLLFGWAALALGHLGCLGSSGHKSHHKFCLISQLLLMLAFEIKNTRKFTHRASKRRCVLFAAVWREPGVIIRRVLFAAGWREPGVVCYHI